MWFVDDEFLNGVATGAQPYIATVTVPRKQPTFDIDVISDARLTSPDADEFVDRFRTMRRPFDRGRASHLLVSCGEMNAGTAGDGGYGDFWTPTLDRVRALTPSILAIPGNSEARTQPGADGFYGRFAASLVGNATMPPRPQDVPLAKVTRVCLREDPDHSRALAYVVVIGFDSNEAAYSHPLISDHGQISRAQMEAAQQLVGTLSRTVALNAPLYVIGVTHHNLLPADTRRLAATADVDRFNQHARGIECQAGCDNPEPSRLCVTNHMLVESSSGSTTNSSEFLTLCRDIRMSMVIHADMRTPEVATMSSTSLASGESPSEITVVACPPFARNSRMSGMAWIRVNVWKGEMEIAFRYDVESDGHGDPIQIVRPLVSASRVTPAERRLYDTVHKLLDDAAAQPDGDLAGIASFRDYVEKIWADTGYVALCFADGTLPDIAPTRRTAYNLLLLLRERDDGEYDILHSHHTALRPSDVGYWNTLLLPAFQKVRNLLEHLRDDVLRQVVDQAEDLEKAKQVRAFEAAVGRILLASESDGDLWGDQLREVASLTRRKISPTTGCVTEYEYHLVTLLPLIRRVELTEDLFSDEDLEPTPAEQERQDYNTIMEWLTELPSVRRENEHAQTSGVSMDALRLGGGGLRWDPQARFPDEAGSRAPDVGRRLPPGAIWFPLPDSRDDVAEAPWQQCPAIVSRNADVMRWVDREIESRRKVNGGVPPRELVMGKLAQTSDSIEIVDMYSFESGGQRLAHDLPAGSTTEAIDRVTFVEGFDLDGQFPYRGLPVKRVYLVRRDVPVWQGSRSVILIFSADQYDQDSCREAPADDALGVLRPVQRYVLRAGLDRAREIHDQVLTKLPDPWGFARVRKGPALQPVTVTPPILERLHEEDWENEHGDREYIVCDGTHRVVELVWTSHVVLPAIAVTDAPRQPYYAKPFSKFEWEHTAGNKKDRAPDQDSKYAVRSVDINRLTPAATAILRKRSESEWYRRYYRDLGTGFGYMGGQGGRYV
ncbi:hypothetical protein ACFQO7_11160 [Catellatospora aurea]|uniref:ParB-like catalytic effector domain-containing protein n=1 Tax=Catellatospora aurea TaxID=1337874 RepID=A0ABW2GUD0_9ACTN